MKANSEKNESQQQGKKLPSAMRYDRVESILSSEPAFKPHLRHKDREIVKRNRQKQRYASLVVCVTEAIHNSGQDAHNVPRNQVLLIATKQCSLLKAAPTPAAAGKPKPKPAKAKPPTKPAAPAAPVAPIPPANNGALTASEQPEVIPSEGTVLTAYSNVSKLSLCISLRNLMQIDDDRFAGFEKRCEAIDYLIADYTRLKDIPTPVSLKSSAAAAPSSADNAQVAAHG